MLTPRSMRRIELLALDRDFARLTEEMGRLGVLHLIDVGTLGEWAGELEWPEADALASDYDGVARRLGAVLSGLGLPQTAPGEPGVVDPPAVLERATGRLALVEPEVERLLGWERTLGDEEARLDLIATQLELLRPLGVSLGQLHGLTFLYVTSGLVPEANLPRLEQSLQPVPHVLVPVRRIGGRVLLFAFASREQGAVLEWALRGAFAEKVDVPEAYAGTPEEALAEVAQRRQALMEQRRALEAERGALHERYRAELVQLWQRVAVNRAAVAAWRSAGRTSRTRLLAGWVPADQEAAVARAVAMVTDGRVVLSEATPEPPGAADEDASDAAKPPTALRNPPLFRAFEGLVRTFGVPDYWALDPTPLAALLFVVMFGAMFGDLGQGMVLALAGIALAGGHLVRGQRDFGVVLLGCGLAAMIFGALYGSFFASESVLPALWARPIENVQLFIQLAVGFGVLAVSLGLLLGIVTAWRQRNLSALAFGPNGVAGLWLYWGLLVLAALAVGGGVNLWIALALVGVPLLLIFLHGPLGHTLGWSGHTEGGAAYYVQAGVESFDLLVRFISNTVSFLRIAAFALSHAGLGITVITLAEMLHSVPPAPLIVLVLGNALIIGLEGLIVGIQALRLQYYEFFTKFLAGRGMAYEPFTLGGGSPERT